MNNDDKWWNYSTKSNHSRQDIHEGEEAQIEDESVWKHLKGNYYYNI